MECHTCFSAVSKKQRISGDEMTKLELEPWNTDQLELSCNICHACVPTIPDSSSRVVEIHGARHVDDIGEAKALTRRCR
jgi:hypothetical protein